ncbi:archease [Methanobacterium petrolearium]|uniref:archease n=1 Tax=Methanobacterium petrolearium TaxID=710190 RepID=UPI001AE6C81E|nr:SHS2 domain-containing protein [Methanobacterium petrolearium]
MDKKENTVKYEYFDVTADVGFRAYGGTLDEAFGNAALAMFEVMTDTSRVKPLIKRDIQLESEDEQALLYDWLSELLFIHDYEGLVFSQFSVKITPGNSGNIVLHSKIWGEEFKQSNHEIRIEVKAVTFHQMEIKKENGYMLQVILDT